MRRGTRLVAAAARRPLRPRHRARSTRSAGGAAVAAPVAPLVAAGLEPGGAALRAAVLNRGRRATREIPQLRQAIERLGSRFDGRLRVAAVDLRSGRRVVFGAPGAPEASVADAVLASCAVPWVFRPVTIGGREYVDGGAWSSANLDAAPVSRGTTVLCLNPTASPRLSADRLGAVRAFARAGASTEALLLRRRGARVRIVAPDAGSVDAIGPNLFDARRRGEVEAAGYRQGRALASARMSLPDHVSRNKASWEAEAENYVEPAKRDWARAEIRWGMYGVPEADVGALPDVERHGRRRARLRHRVLLVLARAPRRAPDRRRRDREPARDRARDAGRARHRVPADPRQRRGRPAARTTAPTSC